MHQRASILSLGALLSGALLFAGCGKPAYPKCESDEQCKDQGEVCIQGMCQECGTDDHCKDGFVCRGSKCAPKSECAQDGDCAAGLVCKGGRCSAECASNGECGDGEKCLGGRCTPSEGCTSDGDCASGQACVDGRCSSADCAMQAVLFEFNEYNLTSDARSTLEQDAQCLKKMGGGTLVIEGHADERGTEEYNLALGERRANTVKKYLNTLGVSGVSLKTVSYGESRPADASSNESAWAKNRRAELVK